MHWALRGLWAIANGAGVFAFLTSAYPTWIEPELKDYPGASGGSAIIWGLTTFPVFLVFFLTNLIWAFRAAYEALRGSDRLPITHASVTLIVWIVAFFFDNSHHGS